MIGIGITFLMLYTFFSICTIGALMDVQKEMIRNTKRLDEFIRILKR